MFILAYPQMILVQIIHHLYSKDGFTYGQSVQYKMLLVRLHVYIDLLKVFKLKVYKLFENSDAFIKKPSCIRQV